MPYQIFDTLDRPLALAVGNDAQWRACCRAVGRDDLAADPALATNAGRVRARERLVAALAETFRIRRAGDWLERLDAAGVPAGVVRPVLEALADVEGSAGSGIAPLPPGTVRRPPPGLDQHGALVRRHGWEAFAR